MQSQPNISTQGQGKNIGQQLLNLNRVYSKPEPHYCGYCNKYGSCSWGFTKQVMHPYTYQLMAEKGWRRSGTYYYKPDIKQSCCKLWTHCMNVNKFKIKKDQRKTVKQVMEWLSQKMMHRNQQNQDKKMTILNKQKPKEQMQNQTKQFYQKNSKIEQKQKMVRQIPKKWNNIVLETAKVLNQKLTQYEQQFYSLFQTNFISPQKIKQFNFKVDISKLKCFNSQPQAQCDFYSNILMMIFGMNKKLFKKQYTNVQFFRNITNFVQTHLNQNNKTVKIQLQRSGYLLFIEYQGQKWQKRINNQKKILQDKAKHIKTQIQQQQFKNKQKQQIYKKSTDNKTTQDSKTKQREKKQNQKAVLKNNNKLNIQEDCKFELSINSQQIYFGPLSIVIVPAQVTSQSWKMYQRYCQQIHEKPQKSQSSYSGFLCQKALKFIKETTQKPCKIQYTPAWQLQNPNKYTSKVIGKRTKLLGCYHMKYYIQKQLIGIGVVDLLPDGLSSVYFFYQPKYKDLRLGVFSSLIEIQYIRWLSLSFPQYKNYYMGFYIQNCVKMNYKGNYQPFELLCPITYQFVQCTAQVRQLIDKIQKRQIKQIQLSKNDKKIQDMMFQDIGVYISQKVKIKYQGKYLTLKDLNPKILIPFLGMLRDMVQVWGKQIFQIFTFTF